MPVSRQFIGLTAGQWTPICDQRDLRRSLLVCAIGADAVLSDTRNSLVANGPVGPVQAGIYLEGGQNGPPTIFSLSDSYDRQLVTREWYARPAVIGSNTTTFTAGQVLAAPSYTIIIPAGSAGMVALWEAGVYAVGGGPSVVTTTGTGVPTRIAGNNVTDGAATARCSLWYWPFTVTGETITVTGTAVADYLFSWGIVPANSVVDKTTIQSSAGGQWTINSGALTQSGDWIVSGIVAWQTTATFNIAQVGFFTQSGSATTPAFGTVAEGANSFYIQAVGKQLDVTGIVPIIWTQTFGTTAVAASVIASAWFNNPATPSCIVSVFEAFDLPLHDDDIGTLTVGLPQLSREGKLHLDSLRSRIAADDGEI